jgi:peroxiredoxin Q/BCP
VEACGFRDRIEQFAQLDTVVIGISTDTLAFQEKFTKKEKLNFPLLADDERKVAKLFGVLMPNGQYARRATVVIDKEGIVAKIYPAVGNAGAHPQEVLDYVKTELVKKK